MSVRIDIPGVGTVLAENAAEESTLRALVNAVNASNTRQRRIDSDIASSLQQQGQAAETASGAMSNMAANASVSAVATKRLSQRFQDMLQENTYGFANLHSQLSNFGRELVLTAVNIGTHFAKNYSKISADPITAGAQVINTALDATAQGLKILGNTVLNVAIPALSKFPATALLMDAAGKKMGEGLQFITETLKLGNNFMAQELQNSVKNIAEFNKIGGSFAGGMLEMRNNATAAGVTLDSYAATVRAARESITNMGLSVTEASSRLAGVLGTQATQIDSSGRTLRDQLLALGYSYEEQGVLAAEYMAQQRAGMSVNQFRMLSDRQIAEGTRKYAEDLKVLTDITGKNAKAALEEARMRSLEADIMAQLGGPAEAERFRQIYAAIPESAKKGFLEFVSSGGEFVTDAATNILMAQNERIREMFDVGFAAIKDSTMSGGQAAAAVFERARLAGQAQIEIERANGGVITQVNRFTGQLGQLTSMTTDFIQAGLLDPDAAEKSRKAAAQQAAATDAVTNAVLSATSSTTKMSVQIQSLATTLLPAYSTVLETTLGVVTEIITGIAKLGTNFDKLSDLINKVTGSRTNRPGPVTDDMLQDSMLAPLGQTERNNLTVQNSAQLAELNKNLQTLSDNVDNNAANVQNFDQIALLNNNVLSLTRQVENNNLNIRNPAQLISVVKETPLLALAELNKKPVTPPVNVSTPNPQEIAEAVKVAFRDTLNESNPLVQSMNGLKGQIEMDNNKQVAVLQQQVSNLEGLLIAMRENVDYSRRIANDLV